MEEIKKNKLIESDIEHESDNEIRNFEKRMEDKSTKEHFATRNTKTKRTMKNLCDFLEKNHNEDHDSNFDFSIKPTYKNSKTKKSPRKDYTSEPVAKKAKVAKCSIQTTSRFRKDNSIAALMGKKEQLGGAGEFFLRGELIMFIGASETRKNHKGIKNQTLEDLQKKHITMDLRVATEDTKYIKTYKKYTTRCATIPCKNVKPRTTLVGSEFLFRPDDEIVQKIEKISIKNSANKSNNSNQCTSAILEEQRNRHEYAKIESKNDMDLYISYISGKKSFPTQALSVCNEKNELTKKKNEEFVAIAENPQEPTATIKKSSHNEKISNYKNTTAKKENPTKTVANIKTSEYLNFFQRDKKFKKFIKKLIEKGECERHKLAYAERNVPILKSKLCSLGNMFFLQEEDELKFIKISYDIAKKYLKESSDTFKHNYATYVILPESIVYFLQKKLALNPKEANIAFMTYHAKTKKNNNEETNDYPISRPLNTYTTLSNNNETNEDDDDIPDF